MIWTEKPSENWIRMVSGRKIDVATIVKEYDTSKRFCAEKIRIPEHWGFQVRTLKTLHRSSIESPKLPMCYHLVGRIPSLEQICNESSQCKVLISHWLVRQ